MKIAYYIIMAGTQYRRNGEEIAYTHEFTKAKTFDEIPTVIPRKLEFLPEERIIAINELDARDIQDAYGACIDRVNRVIRRAVLNKV